MAHVIGLANDAEIARIKRRGFEVEQISLAREIQMFGSADDHEGDKLIMIYVEADVNEIAQMVCE